MWVIETAQRVDSCQSPVSDGRDLGALADEQREVPSVTELEGDVRSLSLYNLCAQISDSPYSLSYSAWRFLVWSPSISGSR